MWMGAKRICLLLSVFLIWATAPAIAAQDDRRLPALFDALKRASGPSAAKVIEDRIWDIWLFNGKSRIDHKMREGIVAMSTGDYPVALKAFDYIVREAPEFSEGWNKRATVYYLMNNFNKSVGDIKQTLALEPHHFGAVSRFGLIYLESGDGASALEAFQRVLRIHPFMAGTRAQVEILRHQFGGKEI
jgi:tetratricopeptide (TPR) repeat protein